MAQPTQTHSYTIEPVTSPEAPAIPAPSDDEAVLLASISALGIDLRVWA